MKIGLSGCLDQLGGKESIFPGMNDTENIGVTVNIEGILNLLWSVVAYMTSSTLLESIWVLLLPYCPILIRAKSCSLCSLERNHGTISALGWFTRSSKYKTSLLAVVIKSLQLCRVMKFWLLSYFWAFSKTMMTRSNHDYIWLQCHYSKTEAQCRIQWPNDTEWFEARKLAHNLRVVNSNLLFS